ncbi:hypothetical protein L3V77_18295 [Vibrio sp. DW001]|uniref:hypothetical protein n=1 Tax=Vibrio sp. DW001 TaxID=2912315 RepID=UPI0023B1EEEF|nr:hypothetical protein [Vibrio sp. DW001]WED29380.1 hypothetical protein L3V77_18295 [Vibrio sp. DW001]
MTKIVVLGVLSSLLLGCVSSSMLNYSDQFSSFKSGDDKNLYCKSVMKEGEILDNCLHQLVIYERSIEACKGTPKPSSCMILNKNLWANDVFNKRTALKAAAFYADTEFEPIMLHSIMLKNASTFTLQCYYTKGRQEVCANQ